MRLLISFLLAYPWQTGIMVGALLLASLAEGLSIFTLLPLLSTAIGESPGEDEQDGLALAITEALNSIGLTPTLGVLIMLMLIGSLIKSGMLLLAERQMGYTSAAIITDLRLTFLRAILVTRWTYFLHQPAGRLVNAISSEAQRAALSYVHGTTLLASLIQATFYIVGALIVSWKATSAALAAGLVIMALSGFLVRLAKRAGKRQTKLLNALLGRLTDTLHSVKPLKAMARENSADSVLRAETSRINQALRQQAFGKAALQAFQDPLIALFIAGGIYLSLVHWQMSFPSVVVLFVLLTKVLNSLGKLQRFYQKMVINESAYWALTDKIREAEQAAEDLRDGGPAATLGKGIELRGVSFGYTGTPVLRDLSMRIEAGSLTTLTGPSGSGKTTVVDLIIGLHEQQDGDILIDGRSLSRLDLRQWRQRIGYVPQEHLLLHDTILHNVTLGDPQLTEADVENALRAAGAWEFVERLPEGMGTMVGERGARLSGGQRQRIMIARALVHRPWLLVLDEATSALDPQNEAAICETVGHLRGRLTVLAISHQTALVEAADRVYRIEDGVASLVRSRPDRGSAAEAVAVPG